MAKQKGSLCISVRTDQYLAMHWRQSLNISAFQSVGMAYTSSLFPSY